MQWEKCIIDLKIALITNFSGDKLPNDHKKVHAKNCIYKCRGNSMDKQLLKDTRKCN